LAKPARLCDAPCDIVDQGIETVAAAPKPITAPELKKVEGYLRRLFGNAAIRVTFRPKKTDSAEVFIEDEFIGVLFVDFQMAILADDLE
jgi:Protein of unknown function (DUF3126)